ncbi:MAG TPA: dTDP-4-dehydrorhamnose reductase [Syntrophus sp. (in: bacteria)]|jgi:dTDP-4-dehydrorhamnose reductase|nr:dTDP-4-dehydrorhamnose reductase [Syntrophus sp. (in: bacteria)]
MKILIIGHKGMLGSDLALRLAASGYDVSGRDVGDVDITSSASCRAAIAECDPEIVINAAAYTDVDACEANPDLCFAVNAQGVRHVATACRERRVKLVHFSTDYIFDGTKGQPYVEEDPGHPLNVYGASKLAGERYLIDLAPDFLLIRTAWLYGPHGRNFVRTILEAARRERTLDVVDDQIGSPTYTVDLAAAVERLISEDRRGIFHITNRGQVSWFAFAKTILAHDGLTGVVVRPLASTRLARPARRPAYSVMSNRKFFRTTGRTMRFWQLALQDCLSSRSVLEQRSPSVEKP